MKGHEVHLFENGTASIRNLALGETMHSQMGADQEAQTVYLEQSGLAERLMDSSQRDALVLYDVGMGIASNALAALDLRMRLKEGARPLRIISFENDLEGIQLALERFQSEPELFPVQFRYRECLKDLLTTRHWVDSSGCVNWSLELGDFREKRLISPPEVVFYDFYSPKTSPQLWKKSCFDRLFQACASRRALNLPTLLVTYSAATFVRSALLLAGFDVGLGTATELKAETTIATTRLQDLERPLDQQWLKKLLRSSKPFSEDLLPLDVQKALEQIQTARQFQTPA